MGFLSKVVKAAVSAIPALAGGPGCFALAVGGSLLADTAQEAVCKISSAAPDFLAGLTPEAAAFKPFRFAPEEDDPGVLA